MSCCSHKHPLISNKNADVSEKKIICERIKTLKLDAGYKMFSAIARRIFFQIFVADDCRERCLRYLFLQCSCRSAIRLIIVVQITTFSNTFNDSYRMVGSTLEKTPMASDFLCFLNVTRGKIEISRGQCAL